MRRIHVCFCTSKYPTSIYCLHGEWRFSLWGFVPVAPYLNHYLCCGKMFNQPFNMLLLFIVIEVMGSIGTNQRQKALSGLNINLLFIWCIRLQIFVYEIFNQQGKMNTNVRGNREPNSRLQIIIFFIGFFVTQFTRLSDSNFLRS